MQAGIEWTNSGYTQGSVLSLEEDSALLAEDHSAPQRTWGVLDLPFFSLLLRILWIQNRRERSGVLGF